MKLAKISRHKNICDECGSILEKTFVISEFNMGGVPLAVWVCPKSECYQIYKKAFDKKYIRKAKSEGEKAKC